MSKNITFTYNDYSWSRLAYLAKGMLAGYTGDDLDHIEELTKNYIALAQKAEEEK